MEDVVVSIKSPVEQSWLPDAMCWLKQKLFFFPDVANIDICSSASATAQPDQYLTAIAVSMPNLCVRISQWLWSKFPREQNS